MLKYCSTLLLLSWATCGAATELTGLSWLSWLSGHWQAGQGEQRQSETWVLASPTLMVGHNITVKGPRTGFEFLRIEARSDGIYYLASPSGRPATAFRLVDSDQNFVAFANPQHDFPKRIEYRCEGDQLVATISDGGDNRSSFSWQRQPVIPEQLQ